jgi:SMP-30/Gluconolactonase/LRE-like region
MTNPKSSHLISSTFTISSTSSTSFGSVAAAGALTALLFPFAAGCGGSAAQWPSSPTAVHEVAAFDGAKGQLSEGVAVRGDTAYMGYVGSGEVVAVDLKSGAVTPYGALPAPVPNMGFVSGLAVHGDALYGALVSFNPSVQPGVYRVVKGGAAELFAKDAGMVFPNGLAFDDDERMYITDSATGAIFRVDADGRVSKWLASPLLAGAKDACGADGVGVPFDIGVNGIAIDGDDVFLTNTDRGQIVQVKIQKDGSAGAPSLLVEADCALSGADGLTLAPDGSLVVAVNHQDKLVRITRDGQVSELAAGAPLDFPASVTFEDGALYISNFAFLDAKSPALLRIR